jgi:hypothetical protein
LFTSLGVGDYWSKGQIPGSNTEKAMWKMYERIVDPMIELRGLKNRFIHLSWPMVPDMQEVRDEWAQTLERRVMGEHYNSISRGKIRIGELGPIL